MVAFYIVLWNKTVIFNSGFVKKVGGVGLLEQGIADVLLVTENFVDGACVPLFSSDTGKGKVCGRLQNFISPLIQVILADLVARNVLASGLVDGHADRIDVLDVIKEFQCAKGIALHLRIVFSGYENSKTVFIVNHVHGAVADENGIRGSEA